MMTASPYIAAHSPCADCNTLPACATSELTAQCTDQCVVIVCNDNGYGAEYIQFRRKEMDPALSLLHWPDLAPIAVAMGGQGVTVRSEADIAAAVAAVENLNGPLLIDLKLDPESLSAITL